MVFYPTLTNALFLLCNHSIRDYYYSIVPATVNTSFLYVMAATSIGSVGLPTVSIYAFARLLISHPNVERWRAIRFWAVELAIVGVIAQCEFSRAWLAHNPLSGWWSLLLFFGVFVSRAIEILSILVGLGVAGAMIIDRVRRMPTNEIRDG